MLGVAVAAAACLLDYALMSRQCRSDRARKDVRGSDPFQSRIAARWFSAHI